MGIENFVWKRGTFTSHIQLCVCVLKFAYAPLPFLRRNMLDTSIRQQIRPNLGHKKRYLGVTYYTRIHPPLSLQIVYHLYVLLNCMYVCIYGSPYRIHIKDSSGVPNTHRSGSLWFLPLSPFLSSNIVFSCPLVRLLYPPLLSVNRFSENLDERKLVSSTFSTLPHFPILFLFQRLNIPSLFQEYTRLARMPVFRLRASLKRGEKVTCVLSKS